MFTCFLYPGFTAIAPKLNLPFP